MKNNLSITFVIAITLLSLTQVGVSSCTKETVVNTTDTVTVAAQDTVLTMQMLTAHPWRVYEQRGVRGNSFFYYIRGGANNTESLDNTSLKFNSNQTGIHTNNVGGTLNFTWEFANPEHTKLSFTLLNTPTNIPITWNNIRYKNGRLHIEEYYKDLNTGQWAHYNVISMP